MCTSSKKRLFERICVFRKPHYFITMNTGNQRIVLVIYKYSKKYGNKGINRIIDITIFMLYNNIIKTVNGFPNSCGISKKL